MLIQKDFNNEVDRIKSDLDKLMETATHDQKQQLARLGVNLAEIALNNSSDEVRKELFKHDPDYIFDPEINAYFRKDLYSDSYKHLRNDTMESIKEPELYVFESLRDAVEVLAQLESHAKKVGTVSLADYYDLVGYIKTVYTDYAIGWTLENIQKATVKKYASKRAVIEFPEMETL